MPLYYNAIKPQQASLGPVFPPFIYNATANGIVFSVLFKLPVFLFLAACFVQKQI